jgi:hypothetical protein
MADMGHPEQLAGAPKLLPPGHLEDVHVDDASNRQVAASRFALHTMVEKVGFDRLGMGQ